MSHFTARIIENFGAFRLVFISSECKSGVLLWICPSDDDMISLEISKYLKDCVHGLVIQGHCLDAKAWYLPISKIGSFEKGDRIIIPSSKLKKLPFLFTEISCIFSESLLLDGSGQEWRYRFAFQNFMSEFSILKRTETLLQACGIRMGSFFRIPYGPYYIVHALVSGKLEIILVLTCEKSKDISLCYTGSLRNMLLCKCKTLLFIAEEKKDRWRGVHVMRSLELWKNKVLPTYGYPGKAFVALQSGKDVSTLSLWTDEHWISFDEPGWKPRFLEIISSSSSRRNE